MTSSTRAALVTGASSGIGFAIATALGELGYDLTVVARNPERLEKARAALTGGPTRVATIAADLAEPDAAAKVLDTHLRRYDRLDALIHSAGVGLFGGLAEQTPRRVDLQIDLNLRALTRLVAGGMPALKKAGEEHGKALVVAISSMVGVQPQPLVVPYSMTKAAQRAYCEGAHLECARYGIQFTAICPALVETRGASWAEGQEKLPVEDVAEAVRFLLATSRSCFIPEIQLRTAGGFTLAVPAR